MFSRSALVTANPPVLLLSATACFMDAFLPMGCFKQVRSLIDLSLENFRVHRIARENTVWCRQAGGAQGGPAACSTGDSRAEAASSAAAGAGGSISYQKAVPFQYPEQPAKQAPRRAVPKMAPLPPPPGKASFAPCNICATCLTAWDDRQYLQCSSLHLACLSSTSYSLHSARL